MVPKSEWQIPTTTNYDFKSTQSLHRQDLIEISSKSVKNCLEHAKKKDAFQKIKQPGEDSECSIIIGVYGKPDKVMSGYDLVSYINLQKLYSERPAYARVEEGEYQYFIFNVNCDTCTLIVAVQSFSGGDPDLYIKYGDDEIPN